MANPLYQQFMNSMIGGASQGGAPSFNTGGVQFQNPMQNVTNIMQAMINPAAFVRQRFPDIPDNIMNDPNQVFNYLQQTHGQVSQDQIGQAQQMAGQIRGQGTVR